MVPGRGRPRQVSADLIAEAATELFLERGYHNTAIDDIAQRAGISRASFFNYFPTKADVLFREIDRALDEVSNRVGRGEEPLSALRATFREITRTNLPIVATHADTMEVGDDVARLGPARVERLRAMVAKQFPNAFDHWVITAGIVSAALTWAKTASSGSLLDEFDGALDRLGGLVQDRLPTMH
jgi:AcrR family transcriptional regulator